MGSASNSATAAADPGEGRVVREQRRDLREREDEDEVEEELSRRDAVLVVDCRRGHPWRPYPVTRMARRHRGEGRKLREFHEDAP